MMPNCQHNFRRGQSTVIRILIFFFNDTATTEIYTLSLHDALPICLLLRSALPVAGTEVAVRRLRRLAARTDGGRNTRSRSEEHTSELQSRSDLVCRLLLEKNKHDYSTILLRSRLVISLRIVPRSPR